MLKKMYPLIEDLLSPKRRPYIFGIIGLVVMGIVILLWPPHRSTAAYCKIWTEETKKLQGRDAVSAASDYAVFFRKLERVAPADIQDEVRVEKLIFEKIAKDPTQAMSASLSGLSASSNIDSWGRAHCTKAKD